MIEPYKLPLPMSKLRLRLDGKYGRNIYFREFNRMKFAEPESSFLIRDMLKVVPVVAQDNSEKRT